jgi:protocatechuate 3,4-dioxygenase beta subunit
MKKFIPLLLLLITNVACSQNTGTKKENAGPKVGGTCEGCEAIYESPVAFDSLSNLCWLPDWNDKGTKLAVNGVVYTSDGKPAAGVVIYIYHTDQTGIYPVKGNETGWGKRHGCLRGWMKTNERGEYKFFTLKPAPYPGRSDEAHIHITIKEPGKNEYWLDEYVFDDDPLLTPEKRKRLKNRGGSGILKTKDVGPMLKAERNIYLGKNIPGYPAK